MKAPRPYQYQLTNGCKEEPSLVDGHVPLLLIVVDNDLGREGVQGEGEKSRDYYLRQKKLHDDLPCLSPHSLSSQLFPNI